MNTALNFRLNGKRYLVSVHAEPGPLCLAFNVFHHDGSGATPIQLYGSIGFTFRGTWHQYNVQVGVPVDPRVCLPHGNKAIGSRFIRVGLKWRATLQEELDAMGDVEQANGERMFLGHPDRWYEPAHWRCPSDHVSTAHLITDSGPRCLACQGPLALTFPEDRDGPLATARAGWKYAGRGNHDNG